MVLAAWAFAAAAVQAGALRTVEGEEVRFDRFRVEGNRLVVTAGGADRAFEPGDLIEVVWQPARPSPRLHPRAIRVGRGSGDAIWGMIADGPAETVRIDSTLLGPMDVPFEQLASVVFVSNEGRLPAQPSAGASADRVYFASGDVDEGMILGIGPTEVRYRSQRFDRVLSFPPEELAGLFLVPLAEAPRPEGAHSILELRDGSTLAGAITRVAENVVEIRDLYGASRPVAAADLASLFVLGGRVTYLSDLDPSAADENANYIRLEGPSPGDLSFPFQRDRNVCRQPLLLRGRAFRKGLGAHAYSSLTYRLDAPAERFEATVGIDDLAGGKGEVRFEVYVGGEKRFDSGPVTGSDPPRDVRVDLTGAQELRLVVQFGTQGATLAYADWGSARIVRARAP